jgi:apolipoprotein N-acyltransferase
MNKPPTVPMLYALSATAGGTLAAAWLWPSGLASVALGWITALLCCYLLRQETPYRLLYLVGLISHVFAFHWLYGTINHFGNFNALASGAIFALFVTVSAVQFLLLVFFFNTAKGALDRWCLAAPTAWAIAETFSIRIFPWHLGHTQLGFTWFAQSADLGGSLLLSFVMIWVGDTTLGILQRKEQSARAPVIAFVSLAVAIIYGANQTANIRAEMASPTTRKVDVLLVQGNVSLEQKHNPSSMSQNVALYKNLTEAALKKPALVIWPETVLLDFLFEEIGDARKHPLLPIFSGTQSGDTITPQASVILGALAFDRQKRIYNSAFAVLPDGSVPEPYHKQLLMPFGEYTPFGDIFPWIKEINATAADFEAGSGPRVFEIPDPNSSNAVVKASPLICYEDVAPRLSRFATLAGAELLVNMTNDAWFGDTAAPLQHNLIASFRAVENKRFLLRATNTGLTNIVNPLGKTTHNLLGYAPGTLSASIPLVTTSTLYTNVIGDYLGWVLLLIWASVAIWGKLKRRRA